MRKILYLECASGISGDMTVAALLDLGGSRAKLDAVLNSLKLDGFEYRLSRKTSYDVTGNDFDVILHDHDHDHEHNHAHEHRHDHDHEHRNLDDVYAVMDRGQMSDAARTLAKKIFRIVAEAEAQAHNCPVEKVHFHEVGAIDSIVDIVAASVLFDDLGVTECVVGTLTEGSGSVRCQHGELPVPVPAVRNIAQTYAMELAPCEVKGEMVTPTGIAIAAAVRTQNILPGQCKIIQTGIGFGKRDFGRANFLRAMLLEAPTGASEA